MIARKTSRLRTAAAGMASCTAATTLPSGRSVVLASSVEMKTETKAAPETAIHRQVADARAGREPRVFARLFSGWAVFGERQFLRGYALLLPDPVVPSLNALGAHERNLFLQDLARLGDAVLKVTGAERINYAILGNLRSEEHTSELQSRP